jgi:hypothetical protein
MARKQTRKAVKRKRVRKTASEVELRKLKLSAVLSERFPPDRVADEVERLLTATAKKFNHLGKVIDESPDFAAIAKGIQFVLHYTEGLPVKREERVKVDVKGSKDLMAYAERSPSFRAALGKLQARLQLPVVEAEVVGAERSAP